jgi:hypothetical protein
LVLSSPAAWPEKIGEAGKDIGGRNKRRVVSVIGAWGTRAAALSLVVMVIALFVGREAVALAAGAVFILAAALTAVVSIVGESYKGRSY